MIKNIEAAKQLIDKYQDFIDNQRLDYEPKKEPYYKALHKHTGFGVCRTCVLCQAVKDITGIKCHSCVWFATYEGSDNNSFCMGINYEGLHEYLSYEDNSPEHYYELLKERIELLKEAIEVSEQLNKEEENE